MKIKKQQNYFMVKAVRRVVCPWYGEGLDGKGHEKAFQGNGNVLYLDRVVTYMGVHTHQNQ